MKEEKENELEELLSGKFARINSTVLIDQIILENPMLFDELYAIAFSENTKAAWRAAWVLSHLNKHDASFLENKISDLMRFIPLAKHDGISRSFLNIISSTQLSEYPVEFINLCFDWAFSPRQTSGIQGVCLKILLNICQLYPEFGEELVACLENADPNDYNKGFVAAQRNALKILRSK